MSDKELEQFHQDIWGSGGTVFLAYKNNPTEFDVPPARRWPEDAERIITFFLTASARGKDVYFSPAIYHDGSTSKHKVNVLGSRCLWVDIDGNAAAAYARVEAGECPPPSYRICSGREGHEHWYWLLDKIYPTEIFEPINRNIAYFFASDGGDKHCWNIDHVLRPPFTRNFKNPKNPFAVDIVDNSRDRRYSLSDFSGIPSLTNVQAVAEKVLEFKGKLPTIADVLADYHWNAQHKDIFLNPVDKKGTRDEQIMRVAYYMAELGMPDEYMYVALDDLTTRMGKFVGRADRERRLSDIILKARAKHPYGESVLTPVEEDIQTVFTANELLNADFHMEWLVENLLPHRTFNIVEALPGTGKSRFTMQWAECLAAGKTFLDWEITRPFKVMYISLEMDRYMTKHFVEGLSGGSEYEQEISDNLLFVPVGAPIPVGTQNGLDFFERVIELHKPEIIFVDALGSLTEDELGEQVSKLIGKQLNKLIAKHDICFILVHHLRKDQQGKKGPPTRSDTYGSQYIAANAALMFALWAPDEQDGSHIELLTLKTRAVKSPDKLILDGTRGFKFEAKEVMEDANPRRSHSEKSPFDINFS